MAAKKAAKKMGGSKKTSRKRTANAQREQELIQLVRQQAQAYLKLPNITSVGVGYRIKDGKETDELAIQFTVARKLSPEKLAAEGLEPLPQSFIAADGTEVPVDVLERSYQPSYLILDDPMTAQLEAAKLTPRQIRRSRRDPVMPGISIGHVDVTAGTFGAVVYDAFNGTPFMLSNWHVLQGPTGALNEQILQPGRIDNSNLLANVAGRLVRSHLGLAGDCAIASIIGRGLDDRIFERGVVPRRVGRASIGDKVVKSGRTTGITFGIVRRVGVVAKMDYGGGFDRQEIGGFEIGPNPAKPAENAEISLGGDSGSVWMVDTQGNDKDVVLGLHFAGETDPDPAAEHAVACNIHSVLEKLQVSFINPQLRPLGAGGTPRPRPRRRR